ncbi:BatD family protein [Cytophagaceae bacterium DM2B3-1]|uniref:BatD family protein n=1 Tax=Xanthocytophaga flava TaxID=3048013 RepID=A0ABT7CER9_9BACT|nr:BatD family protein [Xanthocytophaga flavus]MDJ1492224.1 BatD family protein [Xanthocytophaga flavus]
MSELVSSIVKRLVCLTVLFLCVSGIRGAFTNLRAQSIQTNISARQVSIGQVFYVSFSIKDAKKEVINFPVIDWKGISVLKKVTKDSINTKGEVIVVGIYQMISLQAGDFTLPPQTVVVSNKTLTSSEVSIHVELLPVNQPDFRIEPIEKASSDFSVWMPSVVSGVIVVVLGLLWIGGKKIKDAWPSKKLNPKREALRQLQKLPQVYSGTDKQYYVQLNRILHTYLSSQLGLQTPSVSVNELKNKLKHYSIDSTKLTQLENLLERLQYILYSSDPISFSDANSLQKEIQDMIQQLTLHFKHSTSFLSAVS